MNNLTQSTRPIKEKTIQRNWHIIDAKDKIVGRIAPLISQFLQGKHKQTYSPNLDSGDYVVVINASKVCFSGRKWSDKIYSNYSGYPGGLKKTSAQEMLKKTPERIVYLAVSGMLPKNKLRDRRLGRLYIFPQEKHRFEHKFIQQI